MILALNTIRFEALYKTADNIQWTQPSCYLVVAVDPISSITHILIYFVGKLGTVGVVCLLQIEFLKNSLKTGFSKFIHIFL